VAWYLARNLFAHFWDLLRLGVSGARLDGQSKTRVKVPQTRVHFLHALVVGLHVREVTLQGLRH